MWWVGRWERIAPEGEADQKARERIFFTYLFNHFAKLYDYLKF
jgi:hypothetical protein